MYLIIRTVEVVFLLTDNQILEMTFFTYTLRIPVCSFYHFLWTIGHNHPILRCLYEEVHSSFQIRLVEYRVDPIDPKRLRLAIKILWAIRVIKGVHAITILIIAIPEIDLNAVRPLLQMCLLQPYLTVLVVITQLALLYGRSIYNHFCHLLSTKVHKDVLCTPELEVK